MKTPASYYQRNIWAISKPESPDSSDNEPILNAQIVIKFLGSLDIQKLISAIQRETSRHSVLGSNIRFSEGALWQIEREHFIVQPEIVDVDESDFDFNNLLKASQGRFNIKEDLLVRIVLYRVGTEILYLLFSSHLAVCDQESLGLLVNEFLDSYTSSEERQKRNDKIKTNSLKYSDLANWQLCLSEEERESSVLHWRRVLYNNAPLQLTTDYPRVATRSYKEGSFRFSVDQSLKDLVGDFSESQKISPKITYLAAYILLLQRYSERTDITIGLPGANRSRPELLDVIGPVNSIFFISASTARSFRDLCQSIANLVNVSEKFQDLPIGALEILTPEDLSALHNIGFDYFQLPVDRLIAPGLTAQVIETRVFRGRQDLSLTIIDGEMVNVRATYDERLFQLTSIENFVNNYIETLRNGLCNPDDSLDAIEILPQSTRQKLLVEFNDTSCVYPKSATIHNLFAERALQFRQNAALVYRDRQLNYEELHRLSDNVALNLYERYGVDSNEFIGVLIGRSDLFVIAALGILKAGAAYVPIDPAYPAERINYIVNNSRCRYVITNEILRDDLSNVQGIDLNGLLTTTLQDSVLHYRGKPTDVAYMIYTSGTTGQPKGCMVRHENVVQLMQNSRHPFDFDESDVWVIAHSFCFDFSVWEMYGALLYGGRLVILDLTDIKDTKLFLSHLTKHKVTVLNQTPVAFYQLIDEVCDSKMLTLHEHLRYVIFGGDKLVPQWLNNWVAIYPLDRIHLVNMYGITETTVHVTFHRLSKEDLSANGSVSPIGVPLPGVKVHILDSRRRLLPIGANGELYVGGNGLTSGYWRKESLTRERFISNPFSPGEFLYKTGDIGRWNQNGQLEFVGRNDRQVKLRGYRIELGEIEQRLKGHLAVSNAVATYQIDAAGEGFIVGFVVLASPVEPDALKVYLKDILPEYMIPSFIIVIDKIPLTFNNKVDHDALSALMRKKFASATQADRIQPSNSIEKILLELFCKILSNDNIGTLDNFFEVGGHSLKAIRLMSAIYDSLNVKVDLRTVFDNPTVRGLAAIVRESKLSTDAGLTAIPDAAHYVISNAQKRIWLAHHLNSNGAAYNVLYNYTLRGKVDALALEAAFRILISRHEILRTVFIQHNDVPYQCVRSAKDFHFVLNKVNLEDEVDKHESARKLITSMASRPLNLQKGPLFNGTLIQLEKDKYIFSLVIHHIIADAWSMEVLLSELTLIYECRLNRQVVPLQPLAVQYRDYAAWHNLKLTGSNLVALKKYWSDKFRTVPPRLTLPYDLDVSDKTNTSSVKIVFDGSLGDSFYAINKEFGTSGFVTMLAMINSLLYRYTLADRIAIASPVAGRNHKDLENQIGYFSNTLVIVTSFQSDDTLREIILRTRDEVFESLRHEDYPYDMLIEDITQKNGKRPTLFNVGFTWHESLGMLKEHPLADFSVEPYDHSYSLNLTDLWFHAFDTGNAVGISVDYDCRLFRHETIDLMLSRLKLLVQLLSANPEAKISDISFSDHVRRDKKRISIDLPF